MTRLRLLERNLFYHWRGNLAVFLGVVLGAAVLTGALLVGDSLRGSLQDRVLQRLGWVDHALVTNRFFREIVAAELQAEKKSPAIILQGSVNIPPAPPSTEGEGGMDRIILLLATVKNWVRRLGGVTILGVDELWYESLQREGNHPHPYPSPGGRGDGVRGSAILSAAVARELEAAPGDAIVLHLPKTSAAPRESLLGRTEVGQTLVDVKNLPVAAVLSETDFGSHFSLSSSPDPPRNVYVPLRFLQEQLGQPGQINAVLVGGGVNLEEGLRRSLDLEDWGLVLRDPESRTHDLFSRFGRENSAVIPRNRLEGRFADSFLEEADKKHDRRLTPDEVRHYYWAHRNYISLESRQTLLPQVAEEAALAAAKEVRLTLPKMNIATQLAVSTGPPLTKLLWCANYFWAKPGGLEAAPTFVYLADSIAAGGQQVPYSGHAFGHGADRRHCRRLSASGLCWRRRAASASTGSTP